MLERPIHDANARRDGFKLVERFLQRGHVQPIRVPNWRPLERMQCHSSRSTNRGWGWCVRALNRGSQFFF